MHPAGLQDIPNSNAHSRGYSGFLLGTWRSTLSCHGIITFWDIPHILGLRFSLRMSKHLSDRTDNMVIDYWDPGHVQNLQECVILMPVAGGFEKVPQGTCFWRYSP